MLRPLSIALFLMFFSNEPHLQAMQVAAPCLERPVAERPFTLVRLLDVVHSYPPSRAVDLIRTCGVRVPFDKELEASLREAGAEENVVAAVREVAPKPVVVEKKPEPPPPSPATVPAPVTAPSTAPAGPVKGDMRVNPKDDLRYVYIPPGTFRMGCSPGDSACKDNEKPAHDVVISKGFWMGQSHVTVEAYKKYVRSAGKAMPEEPVFLGKKLNLNWSFDSVPMTMVSWAEARSYCEWSGLRLPTEAQWEYAARAGSTGARYAELEEVAWWSGNSGNAAIDAELMWKTDTKNFGKAIAKNGNRPHVVSQKRPNDFKLYDMLGNAWQWTADWFKNSYDGEGLEKDPLGPPGGEYRVLRGGSWYSLSTYVRSSERFRYPPANRFDDAGFRCAGELRVP